VLSEPVSECAAHVYSVVVLVLQLALYMTQCCCIVWPSLQYLT
jgi:hypothetical protein